METIQKPSKRQNFDVTDSALACVLFILFNMVFGIIIRFIPGNIRANWAVYFILSFLVEFLFAVAAWTVAKARSVEIVPAACVNKKVNGKIVGLGFLVAVVCLFFFGPLTNAFVSFLELCGYSSVLSEIEIGTVWSYLAYIITTCLAPAIFEELLFRGVILSGFKEYGKKVAVVISALIFMLMHGNAEQTIHQFIIGLVIGYIFIESGNLWLGVIVHFFNNFISITELFVLTIMSKSMPNLVEGAETDVATANMNPWLSLLISLIISLALAYAGYRLIKFLVSKMSEESKKINTSKEQTLGDETIVKVDGQETQVSVSVSKSERETLEDEELSEELGTKEKPALPVVSLVMFILSGLYLVYDWVFALIRGFLK